MLIFSALVAMAVPALQEGAPVSWRALPMPALCRSASGPLSSPRLVRGSHLIVTRDELDAGQSSAPALSAQAFASLLGEEARRVGWNVTVNPSFPPLLVKGPAAGCQAAETFCTELETAVRALDVELTVWLVRGKDSAAVQAAPPKDAPWASARVRSGVEVALGERSAQGYVHNYSVEVATDSGVAAPIVARALTGDVLHVRAMRARGGTAVYLDGMLDLARLLALEEFELSATDLGSVQHPRVGELQVVFSGTVASGAPLRVAWGGFEGNEAAAEGSLWIVPRTSEDAAGGSWRVLDTALVEAVAWELPTVAPGGGLETAPDVDGQEAAQPFASAMLAKEADASRNANSRMRSAFLGGNGVVLGPRSETDSWTAIDELRGALEAARTKTSSVTVQRGGAFVRLPVASGARWRVLAAVETTAVVDYDVEIAPETWMPGPRVERALDGFCAQGLAAADHASYAAWIAATPEKKLVERSSVPLGRLELQRRTSRSASGELRASANPVVVLPGTAGLAVGFQTP
ncbi:MAG TPA: hypothetical protein VM509_03055 [Planctomycetota bacterium]|nr:hypothetical protein [Planctomycetota bacterium]